MVEVEDEYWENDARMPKLKKFIIEGMDLEEEEVEADEG
jgi:hypothetical protein